MYTPTATIDRAAAFTRTTGERHYFGTVPAWVTGAAGDDRVYVVYSDRDLFNCQPADDNFRDHGYTDLDEVTGDVYATYTVSPS